MFGFADYHGDLWSERRITVEVSSLPLMPKRSNQAPYHHPRIK
jgi:hypothetical protein